MFDDIVFYYFYWEHKKENNKRFFWHTLLLSIICVKNVYRHSCIRLICYSEPCPDLKKLQRITDIDIIYINNCYVDKNNLIETCCFSNGDCKYLVSKPLDCMESAIKNNDKKIALIDIDFFIFEKFVNINFDMFGVYYDTGQSPPPRTNTGVMIFGSQSQNVNYFFNLYKAVLQLFNGQNKNIENDLKYQIYNSFQSLQEEIIVSLVVRKFWELENKIFYNITKKNHQLYDPYHQIDYSRNIHTSLLKKWRICPVLLNTSKISNIVKSTYCQNAIYELQGYISEIIKDEQEINLISCLENSNIKIFDNHQNVKDIKKLFL